MIRKLGCLFFGTFLTRFVVSGTVAAYAIALIACVISARDWHRGGDGCLQVRQYRRRIRELPGSRVARRTESV